MPLRIALTNPCYFPYVRRGAERALFDLARILDSRGHQVTIITAKPGRKRIEKQGNIRVIYHGYCRHPLLMKLNPRLTLYFFTLSCLLSLVRERYDIVHSLWYADGYAAALNKVLKGTPTVVQILSPPTSRFSIFKQNPCDRWLLQGAVKRADRVLAISAWVRECLLEELGCESTVIMLPVDCSFFKPVAKRQTDRPKILFSGSLHDPRKGVALLIDAFVLLLQKVPEAVLQLSGQVGDELKETLLARVAMPVRNSIQILGAGKLEKLPRLYSEASVTVLPSVFEAQGLALNESLACGTPVVGTNSGGIPEIICDPQIGALFEAGDEDAPTNKVGLCKAIMRSLELAQDPETVNRCRAHAKQFSWQQFGDRLEEVYMDVLNR